MVAGAKYLGNERGEHNATLYKMRCSIEVGKHPQWITQGLVITLNPLVAS